MTEKRFTLKESDIYNRNDVIHDNGIEMPQSTVCEVLNALHEENDELKQLLQTRHIVNKQYEEIQRLKKENEQLKQAYTQLKHRHSLLHDVCIDAECDRDSYYKDVASLEKENEQLESELKALRKKYNDFSDMVDKRLKEMDRGLVR